MSPAAVGRGPGARAIDEHVEAVDGRQPEHRWHPKAPQRFRGRSPLVEATATALDRPPHWHLVTYGMSELESKESDDRSVSGFGFELTLRLAEAGEAPLWAVDLLANLAAYVWASGQVFVGGDHLDLRGPMRLGAKSAITAAIVTDDVALGRLHGPFGSLEFLQLVGVSADELELCRSWSTDGVLGLLRRRDPWLLTDLGRPSILEDPDLAAEAERRRALEGAEVAMLRVAKLHFKRRVGGGVVAEMESATAAALGAALSRELARAGSNFTVASDDAELRFEVATSASWSWSGPQIVVCVPLCEVASLAELFDGRTGWGRRAAWPRLAFRVMR